jgi:hypothetical protein
VWFEPVFELVTEDMFRLAKLNFLICDVAAVDVWMDGWMDGRKEVSFTEIREDRLSRSLQLLYEC